MKKYTTRIIIGVIAVIALSLTLTNCNGRREPNASISAAETQAPSTEVTIESIESTTAPSTVSDETTAPEENTVPETTEAVENRVPADNAGSNTGSSNSGKPTQPVHTHSFVASVTKPTCTEKGYTTYTCFGCDYSYRDTYVTALDHKWGDWKITLEPTVTSTGTASRICTRCGARDTKTLPKLPHAHDYTDTVVKPTCTEKGYTKHTCSVCNDSYNDTYVNALGHSYGEWAETKAPTCTEKGEETRTCSRCDAAGTREIEEKGHTYAAVVTAPTCTNKGYTTHTCACGDSYVDAYVDALGHNWSDWTTTQEPTETSEGTAERSCSRCSATETKSLPKLPAGHSHQYTSEVTREATCSTPGIRTYICSCGDSYTEEIPTTDHMYDSMTTYMPTCTQDGYTVYTCWKCGGQTITNPTPALGHNWSDWVTTQEPTETSEGIAERTCSRCRAKETKSLPG